MMRNSGLSKTQPISVRKSLADHTPMAAKHSTKSLGPPGMTKTHDRQAKTKPL
jgi:hypothetical protein